MKEKGKLISAEAIYEQLESMSVAIKNYKVSDKNMKDYILSLIKNLDDQIVMGKFDVNELTLGVWQ